MQQRLSPCVPKPVTITTRHVDGAGTGRGREGLREEGVHQHAQRQHIAAESALRLRVLHLDRVGHRACAGGARAQLTHGVCVCTCVYVACTWRVRVRACAWTGRVRGVRAAGTLTTTRSPVALSVARCAWPIEAQPTGAQVKELNTSPIGLPSSASTTSRTDASGRGGMSLRNGWKRSEYTFGTTPPVLEAIFCPVL